MTTRLLPAVLVIALAIACASPARPVPAPLGVSPPPPAAAPASLVNLVASVLAVAVEEAEALPTPVPDIAFDEVGLLDQGGNYAFDPKELSFEAGQTVNFALTANSEFHTFTASALNLDAAVNAGETVRFSFTFEAPGTYDLICIPHEALGMVGTIIVQ